MPTGESKRPTPLPVIHKMGQAIGFPGESRCLTLDYKLAICGYERRSLVTFSRSQQYSKRKRLKPELADARLGGCYECWCFTTNPFGFDDLTRKEADLLETAPT